VADPIASRDDSFAAIHRSPGNQSAYCASALAQYASIDVFVVEDGGKGMRPACDWSRTRGKASCGSVGCVPHVVLFFGVLYPRYCIGLDIQVSVRRGL